MKTLSAFARKLAPIIVGVFALLTSCVFENEVIPVPPPAPEGMAEVSFMAEMPAPIVVTTRAVGSVPENKVEDIYVLVFETGTDGELVYKGKGKNLAVATGATNGNRITFKATLPVGETYDFMVLANAEAALAAINVSDAPARKRSDVLALTRTLAAGAKWNASSSAMTPIPMWGELKNRSLAASDAVAFPLTRMLARVNVVYTPENTAVDNFKLASVRVYNYSKSGALVPAAASLETDGITAKNATEPHGGYATQTGGALVYEGTDITDSKSCANMIYLFEAAHNGSTYKLPAGNSDWIDNPCLVVGGKYSADGTNWPASNTYYRVDFIRKTTGGATPAEEWLSLMRNFSYNVTITEVSGEGYDDPETALRSAPFNMEANILPWNERNMEKVVFDGVFYLSVSQDEFVFQRRGTEDAEDGYNTLKIKTDFLYNSDPADAKSGWRVDRIVKAGTDEPLEGDWLHLMPEVRPTGWSPDDVDDAFFTFKDNNTNANREADVWIKAGRLEYKIHVVQKILSLDLLDGSSDDPIEEVTFVIPHTGSTGTESKQFRVEWTPSGQPVAVSGISPVVYNPFEPGWITGGTAFPEPDGNPAVYSHIPPQPNNAVGTETYTVTPPAVTATELATDPFYEKATEYTFSIENLGETIEKSIMLHNIHYALVVDVNKYRLDGGTHTVTARSNTDWKITKVEEWLYNVDPNTLPAGQKPTAPVMLQLKTYDNLKPGTTGGPNLNGDALAFTVVDNESGEHDGKWGTVYVTFESPTGKFPKQTVALQFPPATRLIMGLGYTDVYAVNPGMPSQYHHNSVFQMITSPYNFGSMEESVYKVEGLRVIGYNTQGDKAATPSAQYPDFNWHVNSMTHWLNDDRPDVIFIGDFDSDGPSTHWTENEIQLLDQYVDNGGTLILMYNGAVGYTSRLVRFLEVLLDKTQGSLTVSSDTNTVSTDVKTWTVAPATGAWYTLNGTNGAGETDPYYDDPILNGPFGDVRGKYWGAHYHTAGILTSLLGSDIIPLSNGKAAGATGRGNNGYTTIFRHKTKNILFIGAGGFGASYMPGYQATTEFTVGPVALEQSFYRPVARGNWGAGTAVANRVEVYNSVVLGNAVAWALTVTNHMPPAAPGYQNIP